MGERGLLMPRLRLSPTTMATPPMATPTGAKSFNPSSTLLQPKSSGLLQYKFGNINLSKDVLLIAITAKLPSKTELRLDKSELLTIITAKKIVNLGAKFPI